KERRAEGARCRSGAGRCNDLHRVSTASALVGEGSRADRVVTAVLREPRLLGKRLGSLDLEIAMRNGLARQHPARLDFLARERSLIVSLEGPGEHSHAASPAGTLAARLPESQLSDIRRGEDGLPGRARERSATLHGNLELADSSGAG